MQIYADFLSFFFLPNLRATSAQGTLIFSYFHIFVCGGLIRALNIPIGFRFAIRMASRLDLFFWRS
jgi:hypothetical protein